jgi:hypothetical protein
MAYGEMFSTATMSTVLEASWTPTIIGTSGAGAGTYSNQFGSYKRYSDLVFLYGRCTWSAHTGTGLMEMGTFPISPVGAIALGRYFSGLTLSDGSSTYGDLSNLIIIADDNVTFMGQQSGNTGQINMDSTGDVAVGGAIIA